MCNYVNNKETDFIRNRKLPFLTIIKSIIGMESKSLTNELIDIFPNVESLPSASAFVQQRQKIKAEAFKAIFNGFTNKLMSEDSNDMVTLAVDGSDIQIPTNYDDKSSYHSGSNGQKPHNLLHLNALYDLNKHIYADAIIQGKRNINEHLALQQMVDKSNIDCALIIADRGYESYNSMAHIQEKGWFFLIRIRDGICGIKAGFELPEEPEYDVSIELNLTRKQTIETKKCLKTEIITGHFLQPHRLTIFLLNLGKVTLLDFISLILGLYVLKLVMEYMRVCNKLRFIEISAIKT